MGGLKDDPTAPDIWLAIMHAALRSDQFIVANFAFSKLALVAPTWPEVTAVLALANRAAQEPSLAEHSTN